MLEVLFEKQAFKGSAGYLPQIVALPEYFDGAQALRIEDRPAAERFPSLRSDFDVRRNDDFRFCALESDPIDLRRDVAEAILASHRESILRFTSENELQSGPLEQFVRLLHIEIRGFLQAHKNRCDAALRAGLHPVEAHGLHSLMEVFNG